MSITRPQWDSQLTIPEEAVRKIMLAMNPVIEYPGSSMLHRARRLRTLVETRGWEYAEQRFPEVGRMRGELAARLAAYLEQLADWYQPASVVEDYDDREEAEREGVRSMCSALRLRAAELRGGAQ